MLSRLSTYNFVRMDLPRYYVPLTPKGNIALRLGLHGDPKDLVPRWLRRRLLDLRDKWYTSREVGTNPL